MAMSSTIKTVAPFAQINEIVSAWIAELKADFETRKLINQTRRELLSLSDRDLADIGLSRQDALTMDLTPKN